MTATEARVPVVDLRGAEFSIPSPEPPAPEPEPEVLLDRLRSRRRWVVRGALLLVVVLAMQHVTGMLMADQRQRHLAFEVSQSDARITPGEASMVLQIPDIGLNLVVTEGAGSHEMQGGPGHVVGSAQLADGGNVVILGRRFRFGAPFRRLAELGNGAAIVVRSRGGVSRGYTVERVSRLGTEDRRPLDARSDRLTLVTSGPGLLPDDRTVVVASADAPPPVAVTSATPAPRLSLDVLDQRSSGATGLVLALALLVGGAAAVAPAIRRMRAFHSARTMVIVMLPAVSLLLICAFILLDSILPSTL